MTKVGSDDAPRKDAEGSTGKELLENTLGGALSRILERSGIDLRIVNTAPHSSEASSAAETATPASTAAPNAAPSAPESQQSSVGRPVATQELVTLATLLLGQVLAARLGTCSAAKEAATVAKEAPLRLSQLSFLPPEAPAQAAAPAASVPPPRQPGRSAAEGNAASQPAPASRPAGKGRPFTLRY